jgi:hypothetical protein
MHGSIFSFQSATNAKNQWLAPPASSSVVITVQIERGWLPQPQMLDEVVDFPGSPQFVLAIDMDFVGLVPIVQLVFLARAWHDDDG